MKTLVLFDVPRKNDRQRLESLLRAHGFVWLFPHARWSSRDVLEQKGFVSAIRSRLAGTPYRIVLITLVTRGQPRARWLAADPRSSSSWN